MTAERFDSFARYVVRILGGDPVGSWSWCLGDVQSYIGMEDGHPGYPWHGGYRIDQAAKGADGGRKFVANVIANCYARSHIFRFDDAAMRLRMSDYERAGREPNELPAVSWDRVSSWSKGPTGQFLAEGVNWDTPIQVMLQANFNQWTGERVMRDGQEYARSHVTGYEPNHTTPNALIALCDERYRGRWTWTVAPFGMTDAVDLARWGLYFIHANTHGIIRDFLRLGATGADRGVARAIAIAIAAESYGMIVSDEEADWIKWIETCVIPHFQRMPGCDANLFPNDYAGDPPIPAGNYALQTFGLNLVPYQLWRLSKVMRPRRPAIADKLVEIVRNKVRWLMAIQGTPGAEMPYYVSFPPRWVTSPQDFSGPSGDAPTDLGPYLAQMTRHFSGAAFTTGRKMYGWWGIGSFYAGEAAGLVGAKAFGAAMVEEIRSGSVNGKPMDPDNVPWCVDAEGKLLL